MIGTHSEMEIVFREEVPVLPIIYTEYLHVTIILIHPNEGHLIKYRH